MCKDIINTYSPSTLALTAFSTGYFLCDSHDLLTHHRRRSTYELLAHHALVLTCFAIAIISRQYLAYAGLALTVEVNSVFLHLRQLLIITGEPKWTRLYRANAYLNVGTLVIFRIVTLGWMIRWLTMNRQDIPLSFFCIGTFGLTVIVSTSKILNT